MSTPATSGEKQKQLPIALPPGLRQQLEAAAAEAGHSLAQEVRLRLERTFAEEASADCTTRAMLSAVRSLIRSIEGLAGSAWHQHPDVHRAVTEGVKLCFDLAPVPALPSRKEVKPLSGFSAADDWSTIGRTIARQEVSNLQCDWMRTVDAARARWEDYVDAARARGEDFKFAESPRTPESDSTRDKSP